MRHMLLLTAAITLAPTTPSVSAAVTITDCGQTCTSDCELANDIYCGDGVTGVALANGADLDLKGHSIICNAPVSDQNVDGECSGTGVIVTDVNSVVRDTGKPKGGIIGLWLHGVDCLNKAGSQVSNLVVDGVDSTAIQKCAVIDGNNIIGTENSDYPGDPAIVTAGIGTSGDLVRNNTISTFGGGIRSTGTKPITITGNVLSLKWRPETSGPGTAIAVNLNTSAGTSVDHNTLVGEIGIPVVGNATVTMTDNHCDVTNPDCMTCITNGYCANPDVEYCRTPRAVFKPYHNGSVNQFSLRTPNVASSMRWVLLNDYPEANLGTAVSAITNVDSGTKTDLFFTNPLSDDSGAVYARCTLRAHMVGTGGPLQTTETYLVVKSGTESDGSRIDVAGGTIAEYTRVMTTNPITSGLWTYEDAANTEIGVKNNNTGSGGLVVADVQLDCE